MSWLPMVVTVAPSEEPVTVAEVNEQLRVLATDEDTLVGTYITAARAQIEGYCSSPLVTQTVVMRASCFEDLCRLPIAPAQSITSITYLDSSGVTQTLSASVYEAVLIGLEPGIRLKFGQYWPSLRPASDAVQVTAVVGYGAAVAVPPPVKQAIYLTVSAWFLSRETGDIPAGALALLTNFRS